MNNKNSTVGYLHRDSPIHRLTGTTKLVMVVLAGIAAMITYDTRFLIGIILLSFLTFKASKIRVSEIAFVLKFIAVLMVINTVIIFLFSPEEGVKIYQTRHEIFHIAGGYYVTQEELFYLLNVILKYFAVLPTGLIFLTTTQPSEFAASLNKIGVSYKISYAVSLTLRYIPDIQRDFREISQAQQARGIDVSKNVSFAQRIKNVSGILFPLLLSSLSRIDTISNAMELRGFGKNKKRTWYSARPFKSADVITVCVCVLMVIVSIMMNIKNGGRFYNPFV